MFCHSPYVSVNTDVICQNLRGLGLPLEKMMPVIKANAYGHGLLPVARALRGCGVEYFAVGTIDDCSALHDANIRANFVMLLGACSPDEARLAAARGDIALVHDRRSLEYMAACGTAERPVPIAVKLETGMSRLGFAARDADAVRDLLASCPTVRPELVISHLAVADCPDEDAYTREQAALFAAALGILRQQWPDLRASLANSAALLAFPEFLHDLGRPGICLYGGNPFQGTARQSLGAGLRQAMSVCTTVLEVRTLEAGQSVSYGRRFKAPHPMRIAAIAAGYADGYSRSLTGKAAVVVHGQRAALVGRVCMQMTLVDISHIEGVVAGDTVWLLGGQGGHEGQDSFIHIQELADWWDTIPYEPFCLLGQNPHGASCPEKKSA